MTTLEITRLRRNDPHRGFWDFVETRPDAEKWEFIAGHFVMQARPSLHHQIVAGNLQRLLNDGLTRSGSTRIVRRDPAIDLRPWVIEHIYVPDVAVVDETAITSDPSVIAGCSLAAEILAPSSHRTLPGTRRTKIDAKRAGYEALPLCEALLLIEQGSLALTLSARDGETWTRTRLTGADRLVLPGFGLDCAVADLYARTTLGRTLT